MHHQNHCPTCMDDNDPTQIQEGTTIQEVFWRCRWHQTVRFSRTNNIFVRLWQRSVGLLFGGRNKALTQPGWWSSGLFGRTLWTFLHKCIGPNYGRIKRHEPFSSFVPSFYFSFVKNLTFDIIWYPGTAPSEHRSNFFCKFTWFWSITDALSTTHMSLVRFVCTP